MMIYIYHHHHRVVSISKWTKSMNHSHNLAMLVEGTKTSSFNS